MDSCFSLFLKTKDQMSQAMILLIQELWDLENIIVKKIQCDNSGENATFQAVAKKVWASTLSLWPTRLHSRMAKLNTSLLPCMEGSGQCLTQLDSQESMKISDRGCGPDEPRR